MAVRELGGARPRLAADSRAGFVALASALYLAAGFSATWPAVLHVRTAFLSGGAPGHGEASPGDHLQTEYRWWLVGHQLEHGHAPWRDPFSFRPEAAQQPNFPGWPFGFAFWPLSAAFGPVVGWNLMQLLLYMAAGLVACGWLRELGLPRGSASWLVVSGLALASIPLSGQVHLALGAIPFFLLYALVRTRRLWPGVSACAVAAVGAGILVRQTVIVGSTQSGGRSLDEVAFYSARVGDFFARHVDHGRSEQFVYLGWLTPLLALAGFVLLVRERRRGLAIVLGVGALVPVLLALGTRFPLYTVLWHALPPFRFPRVPERLLPIACLCIAALVAFLVARIRVPMVALVAILVLFADLHVRLYGKSFPDTG